MTWNSLVEKIKPIGYVLFCIIIAYTVLQSFSKVPEIDNSACDTFNDKRDMCLRELAQAKKDSSLCKEITNETTEYYCLKSFGNDLEKRYFCEDGTRIDECSKLNAGLFCDNGELIPKCEECGCSIDYPFCFENKCVKCPEGEILYEDGKCR